MAVKAIKQAIEPTSQPELVAQSAAPDFDFESMIADEILDNLDWAKVKTAMLAKVKQRFFAWITSGNNTPINISAFPELSVLPSSDDVEKAA